MTIRSRDASDEIFPEPHTDSPPPEEEKHLHTLLEPIGSLDDTTFGKVRSAIREISADYAFAKHVDWVPTSDDLRLTYQDLATTAAHLQSLVDKIASHGHFQLPLMYAALNSTDGWAEIEELILRAANQQHADSLTDAQWSKVREAFKVRIQREREFLRTLTLNTRQLAAWARDSRSVAHRGPTYRHEHRRPQRSGAIRLLVHRLEPLHAELKKKYEVKRWAFFDFVQMALAIIDPEEGMTEDRLKHIRRDLRKNPDVLPSLRSETDPPSSVRPSSNDE